MARRMKMGLLLVLSLCLIGGLELKAAEVAGYQVVLPEPNGENGYYVVAPTLEIKHLDAKCITKYQVNLPNGEKIKGELLNQDESRKMGGDTFLQGENVIYTWTEYLGEIIEGSEKRYSVLLDSCAPDDVIDFSYQIENENVLVEINVSDVGSKIREVRYQIGGGNEMTLKGGHGLVTLPKATRVVLSAYAIDEAGNVGSVKSFECDFTKHVNSQNIGNASQQKQVEAEEIEAKSVEHEETERVAEIVDRIAPEILKIEELEGQKLKEFEWDYRIEDVIKEDSSFVCEIRLDGNLWKGDEGSVSKGVHVLEIWARDSAGNTSFKRAQFQIIGDEQGKDSHKKGGSQEILRFLACIMKKFYLKVFKYFVGVFFCYT